MAQVTGPSTLRLMLEATDRRQLRHSAWWSIGIAVLGLLNLFACAYLERFVEGDQTGEGFMVFLAAESFFLLLTGGAVVNSGLETIASRTRILPITAASRYDFIILALLRHRAMLMIAGTAVFAAAILGPSTVVAITGRIVMVSLLMLLLFALMSTLTILRIRPGAAARSLMAFMGLAAAGVFLVAAVASPGPVLHILIPLRWTAHAVAELHRGNILSALPYAVYLTASAGACAWAGRHDA